MRGNRFAGRRFAVLLTAAAFLIALLAAVAFPVTMPPSDRFGAEAWIGPVAVGGLTSGDAWDRVDAFVSELTSAGIPARVGGEEIRLDPERLGLAFLWEESVAAAFERRDRSLARWLPAWAREKLERPHRFSLNVTLDGEALRQNLPALAQSVYRPPAQATIDPETGRIRPGRAGFRLRTEEVEAALRRWLAGWTRGSEELLALTLPVERIEPTVDAATLARLREAYPGFGQTLLTGYRTSFDPALANRSANVALAARLIDGYVLRPGEEFSFNEVVGPRLHETGFLEAPEIVGEEFVEGVGGGICQVSSTLYNAALYADLEITERYRHSVPLGYVPPGRDATLYYGVMDFRFKNSLDQPVIIRAEAEGGSLRISLWGAKPLEKDVRLRSDEREILPPEKVQVDPELPPGSVVIDAEGEPGKWVFVHKTVVSEETGETLYEGVISRNHYPPKPRLIRIGPHDFAADPPPAP